MEGAGDTGATVCIGRSVGGWLLALLRHQSRRDKDKNRMRMVQKKPTCFALLCFSRPLLDLSCVLVQKSNRKSEMGEMLAEKGST